VGNQFKNLDADSRTGKSIRVECMIQIAILGINLRHYPNSGGYSQKSRRFINL
jgi:hypothetical protein